MLPFVVCSVLEKCEGIRNVVEHQDMDPVAVVVPINGHDKVVLSVPVNGTFAVLVEIFCKMVSVLPPNILDDKVIDIESE